MAFGPRIQSKSKCIPTFCTCLHTLSTRLKWKFNCTLTSSTFCLPHLPTAICSCMQVATAVQLEASSQIDTGYADEAECMGHVLQRALVLHVGDAQ